MFQFGAYTTEENRSAGALFKIRKDDTISKSKSFTSRDSSSKILFPEKGKNGILIY